MKQPSLLKIFKLLEQMEKEGIITIEKIGNAKKCLLNVSNAKSRNLLEELDNLKKEGIYASYPKIKAITEELISKVTQEFISDMHSIVLFGSYAKGTATKQSDLDLLFITADLKNRQLRENIERQCISYQNSHNLRVSPIISDVAEFRKMINDGKFNVGKEAKEYGISLYGSEMFWRLVA